MTQPKLRFKGFMNTWIGEPLKTFVRRISKHTSRYGLPRISFDDLNSGTLVKVDNNNKNGIPFSINDVLFGKLRPYLRNWWIANFNGIATGDFWVLRSKQPKFLYALIQTEKYYYIANITSGTKMPRSDWGLVSNHKFNVPSYQEQRLIGRFFAKLDKLISLQQAKLTLLKKQKRGYLQKLFPQKNEIAPRIRFNGFNDRWNKITIKNLIYKGKSGGTPSTSNESYYGGDIPFLSITDVTGSNGNINDTTKKITKDGLNNSSAWLVPKGSLTLSMYASVGEVARLNIDVATSQAFFNMIYKSPITANMMYYVFQWMQHNHGWAPLIATGTQGNLNARKIKSLKILLPSLPEQRLIGDFFKQLDNNINLQKDKLDYLRKLKKAYLQKMFC